MNVLLARITHVARLYKVGVGVSLIGRMRWTAAAREGREIVSHFPLPSVRIRVAVLTPPHAHARTLALPRAPAPSQPSSLTRCCVLFTPRRTSFLPSFPRPPKNAHPRLSGSSGFEYARSLSQWTTADRCWITTARW